MTELFLIVMILSTIPCIVSGFVIAQEFLSFDEINEDRVRNAGIIWIAFLVIEIAAGICLLASL